MSFLKNSEYNSMINNNNNNNSFINNDNTSIDNKVSMQCRKYYQEFLKMNNLEDIKTIRKNRKKGKPK